MSRLILLLILVLISINAYGFTTVTNYNFSDGTTTKNLTFSSNNNQSFYIDFPRYGYVNNLTLKITGYNNSGYVELITADENNSYVTTGGDYWVNPENLNDNDWDTFAYCDGSPVAYCWYDFNYTIPQYLKSILSVNWEVKRQQSAASIITEMHNLSAVYPVCVNDTKMMFRFRSTKGNNPVGINSIWCYNFTSKDYIQVGAEYYDGLSFNTARLYEDSLWINATIYPINISIYQSGIQQYQRTGTLNSSINVTLNSSYINSVLSSGCTCSNCQITSDYCRINFTVHSDTAGILNLEIYNNTYIQYSPYIYFNILSPTGTYLTSPKTTFQSTAYSTTLSRFSIDKSRYDWNETDIITTEDTANNYQTKTFNFIFNYLIDEYNITLSNALINISFASNVDVILRDYQYIYYNGTNINNLLKNISDYLPNDITIEFRKTATTNTYQQIDYPLSKYTTYRDTDYDKYIFDFNLTGVLPFSQVDLTLFVKVTDESGTKIPNAIINVYQLTGLRQTNLTNKIKTDATGLAKIPLKSGIFMSLTVAKEGYSVWKNTIPYYKVENNSESNPLEIKLEEGEYSIRNWALWIPEYYWTLNETIEGYLDYLPEKDITYRTDYMVSTGLAAQTATQTRELMNIVGGNYVYQFSTTYNIFLEPNVHYNNTVGKNITVYVYEDGTLLTTRVINYLNIVPKETADINNKLSGTVGYKFFLFFVLILFSALAQFIWKSTQQNIGIHVFLIGGIFLTALSTSFWVLSVVCLSYYILKSMKGLIGTAD